MRYILILLLLANIVSAGHRPKTQSRNTSFDVAFKSNVALDDLESRLRNLVKEYRNNPNVPRVKSISDTSEKSDYIYIQIDVNNDIYVELDLVTLYIDSDYTRLTNEFGPPQMYKTPKLENGLGGIDLRLPSKYFKFDTDDERMIYEIMNFIDRRHYPNNIIYLSDCYPTLEFSI